MRRPYVVCGGLQDNNAWCGPSALRSTTGPVNTDWFTVAGGDGFYTRQDPYRLGHCLRRIAGRQHDAVTTCATARRRASGRAGPGRGAPGRRCRRDADNAGGCSARLPPANVTATAVLRPRVRQRRQRRRVWRRPRWARPTWSTRRPMSSRSASIGTRRLKFRRTIRRCVYMAAQYFFKSTNRGDTWRMNTTDLTKNVNRWSPEMPIMNVAGDKPMAEKHDGYAASSLATQVRESPSKPGVIWVGTDDGNLQVSQDGGETFTNVYDNIAKALPKATCRSRASSPRTSTRAPPTWRSTIIAAATTGSPTCSRPPTTARRGSTSPATCPANGIIQALREDYDNPNLLFVGTEFGLYVTLDGGKDWKKFMNEPAQRPRGRYSDSPARPRPDHRHARPVHLDRRRHHPAGTTEGRRRTATWCCSIRARPCSGRTIRRRSATPRIANSRAEIRRAAPPSASGRSPMPGKGKVEFLQNDKVVSTMDVDLRRA